MIARTSSVVLVVILLAVSAGVAQTYEVERLCGGPILTAEQFRAVGAAEAEGANINGPTLIRVPDWVPAAERADPCARYYLYFAHHKGSYIRLAWAAERCGPWTLYGVGPDAGIGRRGVLDLGGDDRIELGNGLAIVHHVASPDVVVDDAARRFILHFHGPAELGGRNVGQHTFVATSANGLDFNGAIEPVMLGNSYFRVFRHRGGLYALSNSGLLYRAPSTDPPWSPPAGFDVASELWERRSDPLIWTEPSPIGTPMLPRHSWVRSQGDELEVFFTRVGDVPERIMVVRIDASSPDFSAWRPAAQAEELLRPELDWEGAGIAPAPSAFDWAPEPVNQLRDPFLYEEEGRLYLLHTGGGEQAIGLAALTPQ